MKEITLLIVLVILVSCKREQSDFEKKLVDSNACWIFYNYPESQLKSKDISIDFCTKFYTNNTFKNFQIKNKKLEKVMFIDKEASETQSWNFNAAKNILFLGKNAYNIIKYNKREIILKNENDHIQMLVNYY